MDKKYQKITTLLQSIKQCQVVGNTIWEDIWEERLKEILDTAPSGSGFDAGTKLLREACDSNKLVFQTSFHHMDQYGGYNGWTEHRITCTPNFTSGINLKITGRDKNDIKVYIDGVFYTWLTKDYLE